MFKLFLSIFFFNLSTLALFRLLLFWGTPTFPEARLPLKLSYCNFLALGKTSHWTENWSRHRDEAKLLHPRPPHRAFLSSAKSETSRLPRSAGPGLEKLGGAAEAAALETQRQAGSGACCQAHVPGERKMKMSFGDMYVYRVCICRGLLKTVVRNVSRVLKYWMHFTWLLKKICIYFFPGTFA